MAVVKGTEVTGVGVDKLDELLEMTYEVAERNGGTVLAGGAQSKPML